MEEKWPTDVYHFTQYSGARNIPHTAIISSSNNATVFLFIVEITIVEILKQYQMHNNSLVQR